MSLRLELNWEEFLRRSTAVSAGSMTLTENTENDFEHKIIDTFDPSRLQWRHDLSRCL